MGEVPLYHRTGKSTSVLLILKGPSSGAARRVSQCEAVPRRARIEGSQTFASLNSRLKRKEEKKRRRRVSQRTTHVDRYGHHVFPRIETGFQKGLATVA